jgi:hypothetical protein
MGRLPNAAGKEELVWLQTGHRNPGRERIARELGDLKLHRPLGLLLHDDRARGYMTALDHIVDTKLNQIAPAQLAVDGEVEQCEFPGSMIQLQPNPDGADLLQLQWWFLAEQLARRGSPSASPRYRPFLRAGRVSLTGQLETFGGDAKISRKQSPAGGCEASAGGVVWSDLRSSTR